MRLLDVLNAPWAIMPEKLIEIRDMYLTHLRGEKIDVKAIEAAIGKPLNNKAEGYTVDQGVAIVGINGVIAKRANLFTQICGGTSTQLLARDVQAAADDPTVHSIILAIESPGGEVDGTQAAADVIRSVRGKKPIVTLVDGLAASAGYWLGSAADKVYITGDTAMVGSIGVVMTHTDYSQAEKARGVNVTEITAGKYKRIASEHAPLSQEGRASIQDMVDHIYSVFVDAVAQSRGVSADTVHEKMADGRVFLGKQAIDAGLVDGVSSMDALIADLNQQRTTSVGRASKGALPPKSSPKGEVHVEGQVFVIGGAEIKTQAELDEAVKAACATASTAAATAERERIQAVESQALPGHEALIASLKFDGKSTGGDAAVAVLAAEKKLRGDAVSNLKKDAPKPVATAAPDQQEQPEADAGDGKSGDMIADAKVVAEKAKAYVVEQKAQGNKHITFAEAVAHVSKKEKQ